MVRHHVKNKNKKRSAQKQEPKPPPEEELLKNLDRFAGSSEEEESDEEHEGSDNQNINDTDDESISESDKAAGENNFDEMDGEEADGEDSNRDDDDSSDDDEYGQSTTQQVRSRQTSKPKKKSNVDTDDDSEEDEEEDDDRILMSENGEIPTGQAGMAGAMAKILGFSAPTKKDTKAVVLSKTVTPLQKQQKKEKAELDALKLKRKQRREVNLTAMHIPLSAATSRPIIGKGDDQSDLIARAMAQEIQQESMHRRVATRGVVALFNTIAKHQQQRAQQQAETSIISKKGNEQVKSMSKHGFLDMLKKSGTGQREEITKSNKSKSNGEITDSKSSTKGWNALKDDFMMNSKLKDWDKALSSDDDSGEDEDVRGTKRGADVDDVMDDDWSSDDDAGSNTKKRKIKM